MSASNLSRPVRELTVGDPNEEILPKDVVEYVARELLGVNESLEVLETHKEPLSETVRLYQERLLKEREELEDITGNKDACAAYCEHRLAVIKADLTDPERTLPFYDAQDIFELEHVLG